MRSATQALILTIIFIACTAFTLGITWAPCYASLCSEEFFPADVRYHIAAYFALIASIAIALVLRAYSPACHRLSTRYLTRRPVPIFGKHFTIGGVSLAIWVLLIVLITTIFWVEPLIVFWKARTELYQWSAAQVPLVVTGIIGHHADLLLGLLLIPVGRNSLLVKVFKLPYSTLLYAHKLLAYLTVIAVGAHGVAYIVFWARYNAKPYSSPERAAFEINNPTLTVAQSQARGVWSRATLGTGLASFAFMLAIVLTALPVVRRQAYNLFYYAHIMLSIGILVGASVHASTNFYFLTPGLLLWTIDWTWRLFGGEVGLAKGVQVTVSSAGGDWYRIVLPPPLRSAVTPHVETASSAESPPLQTYFINIPAISNIQNHALTAARTATSTSGAVLLLQKASSTTVKRSAQKQEQEWTWKLARLIEERDKALSLSAHIEGPYEPPCQPYQTADLVICVVGGTGLTGGYSLARWWLEHRSSETSSKFALVWTFRHEDNLQLEEWTELVKLASTATNMSVRSHCSALNGRLDIRTTIGNLISAEKRAGLEAQSSGAAWVYASGPASLLTQTANICIDFERAIRQQHKTGTVQYAVSEMTHSTANWEV